MSRLIFINELSTFLYGFVNIFTGICQICNMDLSKLLYMYLSPFTKKKTKLKFDPASLIGFKNRVPWIRCAFGHFYYYIFHEFILFSIFGNYTLISYTAQVFQVTCLVHKYEAIDCCLAANYY